MTMPHINLDERLPGILSLMAFRPQTAKALNALADALLVEPSSLSRGERELIAAFVSSLNVCEFCCDSHSAFAAAQLPDGHQIVAAIKKDVATAPISAKMKSLLYIAQQVQQSGQNVTTSHILNAKALGATDEEIHDTVLIAAAFCMFNRYVDGLSTHVAPKEAYEQMAQKIILQGYKM
jgi:uncharacterized peroxidase-related enzyme